MTVQWNGQPASAEQLEHLAFDGYGCFTTFQVRRRAVRGLSLHLQRLHDNATELFGLAPDGVQELVARAVTTSDPLTVRVTLVSQDPDLRAGRPVVPDVVVSLGPPREGGRDPMRVRTTRYERETPHVKHRATHGLVRETRAARQAGFDDAVFLDRARHLSEGPTWNLLLHDGDTWVWPQAEILQGVTQQLVRQAMTGSVERPVTREQLPRHVAAFALNSSTPGRPLAVVDEHHFAGDSALTVVLEDLWSSSPPEPL